jgi:hypothetical protein
VPPAKCGWITSSITTSSTSACSRRGSPERSSHSITSRRRCIHRVSTLSHAPTNTSCGRRLRSQPQRPRTNTPELWGASNTLSGSLRTSAT